MSHVWKSHVSHVNQSNHTLPQEGKRSLNFAEPYMSESSHTYEWVMSHSVVGNNHVTRMIESCRAGAFRLSRRCLHMNESYHTYEWVISHIWMSTYELHRTWRGHLGSSESRHIHEWVMWHVQIAQDQKGALSFEELRSWLAAISTGSERAIQDDEVKWVMSMAAQVTHVLQCVAVCCSALQCVAVCCPVLQCVAVCCSVLQCVAVCCNVLLCVAVWYSVVQSDAQRGVTHSCVLHEHCITLHCNTLHAYMGRQLGSYGR